jgi:hypothetical protein
VDMHTASQLHAKTNSITMTNYRASYDLFFGKRCKTRVSLLISTLELLVVVGENGKEKLRVYMVQRLVTSPIPYSIMPYMRICVVCCTLTPTIHTG